MRWTADNVLELIDQRLLPFEIHYARCRNAIETASAITDMVVRGAPAIGCAAAFGLALEGARVETLSRSERELRLSEASATLRSSRPTAVNLFWALDRMDRVWRDAREADGPALTRRLRSEATRIFDEDLAVNLAIGRHGAPVIADGARVMTHCNAGALATAGHGTALGTRIAVQTVLEFLGAGDEIADVLEEYPSLTREDVLACLRYSSRLMSNHFTLQNVA